MNKKAILWLLSVSISTVLLFAEFYSMWTGRLVNQVFPCEQAAMNSFPCFGVYDIAAMAILLGTLLVSLVVFFITIVRKN